MCCYANSTASNSRPFHVKIVFFFTRPNFITTLTIVYGSLTYDLSLISFPAGMPVWSEATHTVATLAGQIIPMYVTFSGIVSFHALVRTAFGYYLTHRQ